MNLILVVLVVLVIIFAIGSKFWLRIFPVSYSQGEQEILGRVTIVERLPGDLVEVTLTVDCTIDPKLQQGPTVMTGCQIGNFVHFRPSAKLPGMGDVVVAQTVNRSYPFRERSLNWVTSWNTTDRPPIGGHVALVV